MDADRKKLREEMEASVKVVTAPDGKQHVTVDAELFAAYASKETYVTRECPDDHPILKELFGDLSYGADVTDQGEAAPKEPTVSVDDDPLFQQLFAEMDAPDEEGEALLNALFNERDEDGTSPE